MARSDVPSRFEPRPGRAVSDSPVADRPSNRGSEVRDAKPAKTRTRKILNSLFVFACVTPVVILYEMAVAPTCSSDSVGDIVKDIVESKLLHARKFSVALSDVKVLERNVFGDKRCSADVDVDGKAISRRVEYRWTTNKGHLDTVYAKMRP